MLLQNAGDGAGRRRLVWRVAFLSLLAAGVATPQPKPGEWQPMFDGKSLAGWREAEFLRRGKVRIEQGALILGAGGPMTGVTWTGAFPSANYEVRFEAARLEGNDFFASLTFPAGKTFCTWVTGGWGGDIVGLSNLDGWDASENDTRTYYTFEKGRWYNMRLKVTDERIMAWIDEEAIINISTRGREIELRFGEIRLSAPFGFASYRTTGAVRKIEYRLLPPASGGAAVKP